MRRLVRRVSILCTATRCEGMVRGKEAECPHLDGTIGNPVCTVGDGALQEDKHGRALRSDSCRKEAKLRGEVGR